ncbi:MAG: YlbE-like family protein [Bacillus sp. (in: firmicutes)]
MRIDVYTYLQKNRELIEFLREQPIWYRKLSRDPSQIEKLEIAALHYYQKTIPHQIEKFSNGVQMASMMVSMFKIMNEQS